MDSTGLVWKSGLGKMHALESTEGETMAGLNDLLSEGSSLKTPGLGDAVGGSSNKELMANARRVLSGNWGKTLAYILLFYVLLLSVVAFFYSAFFFATTRFPGLSPSGTSPKAAATVMGVVAIGILAVSSFFYFGWCNFFRTLASEGEARLEALVQGGRRLGASMLALFLYSLIYTAVVFGGAVLSRVSLHGDLVGFILIQLFVQALPIYLYLRYSMVFFLLSDEGEDVGAVGAIRRSSEIMVGFKWKLFRLFFRFFWWGVLFAGPLIAIAFLPGIPAMRPFFESYDPWVSIASSVWYVLGYWVIAPYVSTAMAPVSYTHLRAHET